MTRDYSKFIPLSEDNEDNQHKPSTLETLGWQTHFAQQIDMDDMVEKPPVRITEVHRNALHVVGDNIDTDIAPISDVTVGDWLLYDPIHPQSCRVLERKSIVKRRAPSKDGHEQLIAANIDTAFIVSSCNQEFNVARIERYIALAFEAGITPVIVLTKVDLAGCIEQYKSEAQAISQSVSVVCVDARGDEPRLKLAQWCKLGKTVAFLGSSGVGKSTLTNSLAQNRSIKTQSIREDDAKGRHTTTGRQLYLVPNGCLVLDTPGMRELQLTNAASGIKDVFADFLDLASQCRFNDCQHVSEPGCAVLDAIKNGDVDQSRFDRWRKLKAEEAFNTASLAQRKNKSKVLSKTIRLLQKQNQKKNKKLKKKRD